MGNEAENHDSFRTASFANLHTKAQPESPHRDLTVRLSALPTAALHSPEQHGFTW